MAAARQKLMNDSATLLTSTMECDGAVEIMTMLQATSAIPRAHSSARATDREKRLIVLRVALLAVCDGKWDDAEAALLGEAQLAHDPAFLNLLGIVRQAQGRWNDARRLYRKAVRADRRFLPAEQNIRRFYELDTFGSTRLPIG